MTEQVDERARPNFIGSDLEVSRRKFLLGSMAVAAGATLGRWIPTANAATGGGRLEIITWEGYSTQKEAAQWLTQNGIILNAATMGTQDDVTAKLVGNPVRLDVAEYAYGYNDVYKQIKALTPIDVAKVPNYNSSDIIDNFYKGQTWFFDGQHFGIPWCWGMNSIVYNPSMVPEITSYKDLLRKEFKGKLAFVDDTTATWPLIARLAGYGAKFPNLTKEELAHAFKEVIPYREQSRVFAPSNGDIVSLFVAGEIAACFCVWSAVPVQTALQGVTTKYVIPEEGANIWADAWFIPMTAVNREAALSFINHTLDPQVQADVCRNNSTGVMNRKAVALLDEQTRSLFDYENLDRVFAKSPMQAPPPQVSGEFATYNDWLQAWSDFKSGF